MQPKAGETKGSSVPPSLWFSCRLWYFIMSFFGITIFMILRNNINFALVCMVKPSNHWNSTDLISTNENATNKNFDKKEDDEFQDYCQHSGQDLMNGTDIPKLEGVQVGFEWDKSTEANLLAAFFYGFAFTNIPGGWAADSIGGKKCLVATLGTMSLLTLLNPIAAMQGPWYLFAVRFLQGVSQGPFLPLVSVLGARWAGASERGFLLGLALGGINAGLFVANWFCAFICKNIGWAYIFYLSGALGIIWCIAAYFFVYAWPENHPRISKTELTFIQKNRSVQPGKNKKQPVPWKCILTSVPVASIHLMHFAMLWGLFTIAVCIPLFFKEILKMDVSTNGILASVPFFGMFIVHFVSGWIFDAIRQQKYWANRLASLRKIFNTIGIASYAIFIPLITFFSCIDNTGQIVSVFIGLSFVELAFTGGYLLSVFELAPRFAGIIFGISNTFGVLPGFLCPVLAAYLTPNGSKEEWLLVFYISAAILCTGGVTYLLFGSTQLQPWADLEQEVEDLNLKPLTSNDTNEDEDQRNYHHPLV